MKLFVWVDPYEVSYGSSLLMVVADTVTQARELAKTGKSYSFGQFEKEPYVAPEREPDRIVDCPCAEWHVWCE